MSTNKELLQPSRSYSRGIIRWPQGRCKTTSQLISHVGVRRLVVAVIIHTHPQDGSSTTRKCNYHVFGGHRISPLGISREITVWCLVRPPPSSRNSFPISFLPRQPKLGIYLLCDTPLISHLHLVVIWLLHSWYNSPSPFIIVISIMATGISL